VEFVSLAAFWDERRRGTSGTTMLSNNCYR